MPNLGSLAHDNLESHLLVWDGQARYPENDGVTLLWRAFEMAEVPNLFSIPQLIEENADVLRASYLAWVYDLGEMRINGIRLVDNLQIRAGFSYWWMTLLVEKCNYSKSPLIDDAIRMLAFNLWTAGRKFERLTLASANRQLAVCMRSWCVKNGVMFEWQPLTNRAGDKCLLLRIFAALPLVIQAWIWLLKYLLDRWSLRGVGLQAWRNTRGKTTFVSYSDNCVPDACKEGRYENRYWARLPAELKQESITTNWLHIYAQDNLLPTARHAASAIDSFNVSSSGLQCHVTLDTFIDLSVIFRTVRDWFYLIWYGVRFGGSVKPLADSSLDLWPLLKSDWRASMFGAVSMSNVLYLNLFEAALKVLPKQQGFYLEENMGWEFGFICAWRRAGHGRLIGVPHSTVRFWDLRYFFDARSYLRTGQNDLPLPDRVACNGPVMRDAYEKGGYPPENLLDVEALRYLHLSKRHEARHAMQKKTDNLLRLLVLGDYLHSNNRLQMMLLEHALSLMPKTVRITVKPHPNCPIDPVDYRGLEMQVSMEPIEKLLAECDVAYASAVTSAAVDAYCAGVPTISVLDSNTLNLSPLRGCAGVFFVGTGRELSNALIVIKNNLRPAQSRQDYFMLDELLPNWRKLTM